MSSLVRHIIRSPHMLEVLVAYGGVHLISLYLMLFHYKTSWTLLICAYLAGGSFYTFIEYWFHRTILHEWIFKEAHQNHHLIPIKLKIIATPLLVVQLYEIFMMCCIAFLFGTYWAVFIQVGVSISQVIMDYVHLFEHTSFNPWFLWVARDYHKLHHHKDNWDLGHGLTTRFWDIVFRTYPDQDGFQKWGLSERYWIFKYIGIPLPLVDFILLTPFLNKPNYTTTDLPSVDWLDYKLDKMLIAAISAIAVGFSPYYVNLIF